MMRASILQALPVSFLHGNHIRRSHGCDRIGKEADLHAAFLQCMFVGLFLLQSSHGDTHHTTRQYISMIVHVRRQLEKAYSPNGKGERSHE